MIDREVIIDDSIMSKYYNLKHYIEKEYPDVHFTIIKWNNGYEMLDCKMPYFFDGKKFSTDMKYEDLPFSLYAINEITDVSIKEDYSCGKGGIESDTIFEIISQLYYALNEYIKENPLAFELSIIVASWLFKAANAILENIQEKQYFYRFLEFVKRRKIDLNLNRFRNCNKYISEEEKREINKGFKILQELNEKGLLQKALNKYNEEQKAEYEKRG